MRHVPHTVTCDGWPLLLPLLHSPFCQVHGQLGAIVDILCTCCQLCSPLRCLQSITNGLKQTVDSVHLDSHSKSKQDPDKAIILVEYTVFPAKEAEFVEAFGVCTRPARLTCQPAAKSLLTQQLPAGPAGRC